MYYSVVLLNKTRKNTTLKTMWNVWTICFKTYPLLNTFGNFLLCQASNKPHDTCVLEISTTGVHNTDVDSFVHNYSCLHLDK